MISSAWYPLAFSLCYPLGLALTVMWVLERTHRIGLSLAMGLLWPLWVAIAVASFVVVGVLLVAGSVVGLISARKRNRKQAICASWKQYWESL